MPKLEWDKTGERFYETGVEKGVAWNGLTAINEKPTGAEPTALWADNTKYLNLISNEEFEAGIEAYTYPDEFKECDGSKEIAVGVSIGQQARKMFGLSYVTKIGNDVELSEHGYKIHLIYGATASPSEKGYSTINDSPDAITFSWDVATTPVNAAGHKPTASLEIDSTKVDAVKLAAFEKVLYGDGDTEARLPLPDEIAEMFKSE